MLVFQCSCLPNSKASFCTVLALSGSVNNLIQPGILCKSGVVSAVDKKLCKQVEIKGDIGMAQNMKKERTLLRHTELHGTIRISLSSSIDK